MVILLTNLALPLKAQERVNLDASTGTATVSGTLKGDKHKRYVFNGNTGQTVAIEFHSSKPLLYYNVIKGDEAIFNGSAAVDEQHWSTTLSSGGDFLIDVHFMRAQARRGALATYTLSVSVINDKTPPQTTHDLTVEYRCTDGKRITVTYINDRDPAGARVVVGENVYDMEQAISGSGARYAKGNAIWWNKGRDGTFELDGMRSQCRQRLR
jgi:membrane-bound inhibitor of C-type lysozyme